MSKIKRLQIIFCVIVGGVLVMSCSPEAAQDEPMQMPFKENTWVRKEEIKKTKSTMFSAGEKLALPIDDRLVKKLNTISTSSSSSLILDIFPIKPP